mgnify:CR=1 FL=1
MPRVALAATLALAALLLATACTDGDTPEDPDLLVAAAASFQQVACEPVPLQLINTRTGETRLGPTERYVTIAVSPTGDRVAAARLDWNLCGPDDPTQPETLTLFLVDVATLEVAELLTSVRVITSLHWSPAGEYLALVGIQDVVLYEVATKHELAVGPRENTTVQHRSQLGWPDAGPYLFLYSTLDRLIGLSPDPALQPPEWTFDCPDDNTGYISRVHPPTSKHVAIDFHCDNIDKQPASRFQTTLDLSDGTQSTPSQSDAYEQWLNESFEFRDRAREQYPGAVTATYDGTDATGQLRIRAILYLPDGGDLLSLTGSETGYPTNIKTQIAIDFPSGGTIHIPLDITYTDPDFGGGYAPLHDVAILLD